MKARIASLSFDVDDKWSYMKTHGDAGWDRFPSYLGILLPRVLRFLEERGLLITFFIVGQDAAFERNHEPLKAIAAAGHEIGNHSFAHEPWLHLYTDPQIGSELAMAEEHIERASGERPVGFRGPGYSLSGSVVRELARRGYEYDASTFPSLITPLARAYYLMTGAFSPEQKALRKKLGGSFRDSLRPVRPYRWRVDGRTLVEIPVTTMPILRLPIHMSYLLCLKGISAALSLRYFESALRLCRLTGIEPSILLHPTDFLSSEDAPELAFFPGMRIPAEKKLEFVDNALGRLTAQFKVVSLRDHARQLQTSAEVVVDATSVA